ncbi:NADH oxidase [subsurface metagenome]
MKAAITAVERGHDVTLVEKSNSLGGMLKISDYDPLKADMKAFKDYLVNRTLNMVKVRFNTEATPELIEKMAPDVVLAAVGSSPIYPDIPGVKGKNVVVAEEAYCDVGKIGEKVAVIGGGLVGCEIGLYLTALGKKVTIVEMRDAIGDPADWRYTLPLITRMKETPNLQFNTSMNCLEITSSGIKVAAKNGKVQFIEADMVILAAGRKPNTDTVENLRNCVPEFYPIGDCVKPQRIMEAMQGGYFAALDIL